MEQVACNLCGSTQLTPVYQKPDTRFFPDEVFTVVECNHCGLGFLNPRPTLPEMAKYYPPDYYEQQQLPPQPFDELPAFRKRRVQGKVRFLKGLESRSGEKKLLDVGCGNGDFVRFMLRRGWQVEAVEISEHAARVTEFHVYREEFHHIPVNAPTYDAITLWAVLEHVHDPMAYFRKAVQVLKPDGRLVFLVHNFHSMASRYLFGEDIPRHLYFYTRETVAQYLQKNGLVLESEDNSRSIYKMAPAHWLSYLIQTRLRGKPFTFADAPLSSREFRRVHGLSKGVGTSLKYLAYSPVSVVERILFPAVEAMQILRKTYGVSTYVARKG